MRAELSAQSAQSRHPDEVDQVLKALKTTDANQVSWEYDMAVRIHPGFELSNQLKGIERFRQGAENKHLLLVGRRIDNKKRAGVDLDSVALAQDPNKYPQELYGMAERPQVGAQRSLWLWKPNEVGAPGWNEAVLVGGVTDGKTTVLRLATDSQWPHRAELIRAENGKAGWGGTHLDASGRLHGFGTPLLATMGAWADTGQLAGVTAASTKALAKSNVRVLTDAELDQVAASFSGGFIAGTSAGDELISDIFKAFARQGMPAADNPFNQAGKPDESTGSPIWGPRKAHGRKWAWGQGLAVADLEGYAELMSADSPASFSAMDVLTSAFDPNVRKAKSQAHELLLAIAMGETPDDAYTQATGRSRASKGKKPSP